MAEQQVKSRQRVVDHGEVFTAEREVKAMCDLVKQETERIESRFLEPACGNGNFLAEVLTRKLAVVKSRYGKSPFDYERYGNFGFALPRTLYSPRKAPARDRCRGHHSCFPQDVEIPCHTPLSIADIILCCHGLCGESRN